MVRYNQETTTRGYTFRLQEPEIYSPASVSSTSSISSSAYKERIDSLFRFDDIETQQPEFTVEQLKQQLQEKLFQPQKQADKAVEENDRSKSFSAARTVVQAHIEKLIETKSSAKAAVPVPVLKPDYSVPIPELPVKRENLVPSRAVSSANSVLSQNPTPVSVPVLNFPKPPIPVPITKPPAPTPPVVQPVSVVELPQRSPPRSSPPRLEPSRNESRQNENQSQAHEQVAPQRSSPPRQEPSRNESRQNENQSQAHQQSPQRSSPPRQETSRNESRQNESQSVKTQHQVSISIQAKQNIPLPPIPSQSANQSVMENDVISRKRTDISFEVDYLGSVILHDRATSLDALQSPLKDLYFRYRSHLLSNSWNRQGTLEIGNVGMRIVYSAHGRVEEIFNPFPTIAVWAAVKFVYRKDITGNGAIQRRYAFLPLICDPENQEKQNLFNYLSSEDVELATAAHPPMFACVMRKPGVAKILECHAFICSNPEDAVVIAANLYQALLENMKFSQQSQKQQTDIPQKQMPKYSPDSSVSDTMGSTTDVSSVPVRPPRRKKRPGNSDSEYEAFEPTIRRVEFRRSQRGSNRSRSSIKSNLRRSMRSSQRGKVKRSISERVLVDESGELVNKVTIPRSKSFAENMAANSSDMSAILNELKSSKGPKNVDDILKAIVNKKGMSFNELEPAYKALLLKLACTLSKDELYHKSKLIMKDQTKQKEQGTSKFGSFLRATKRSVSRLSNKSSSIPKHKDTKNGVTDLRRCFCDSQSCAICRPPSILKPVKPAPSLTNLQASISDCTYDTESCYSDKCYCSTAPRNKQIQPSECETDCGDTDRCYCSVRSKAPAERPSFKGSDSDSTVQRPKYVRPSSELGHSTSSYFSDTCDTLRSATSAGSFARNPSGMRRKSSSLLGSETDSIIFASGRRFEGFGAIPNFRKNSIGSDYHSNESGDSTGSARGRIISRTAKSLSNDNLSGIGSLVHGSRGSSVASSTSGSRAGSVLSGRSVRSGGSDPSKKVLMVSAIDPSGKVLYRGAQQQVSDSNNVFAMKKTAEIAALFSDLKLNTTTDIVLGSGSETETDSSDDAYSSLRNGYYPKKPAYSGTNLENSLGYLP